VRILSALREKSLKYFQLQNNSAQIGDIASAEKNDVLNGNFRGERF